MGVPNPVVIVHDVWRQSRPDKHVAATEPFQAGLVPPGRCSRLSGSCGISSSHDRVSVFILHGIPHSTQRLGIFRIQPGKLRVEQMSVPVRIEIQEDATGPEDAQPLRIRPVRVFQIPCKVAASRRHQTYHPQMSGFGHPSGKSRRLLPGNGFDVLPGTLDHGFAVVHPVISCPRRAIRMEKKPGPQPASRIRRGCFHLEALRDQFIPYLGLNSTKFIRIDGGIGRYPARPVGPDRFQAAPIHNGLTGMTFKKPGRVRSTLASTS